MEFKSFYSEIQDTQVDVLHQDASVHQPSTLSDLLGVSTSMDVSVDSVETELNAYTRVYQVPLDTDPLMWWSITWKSSLSLTVLSVNQKTRGGNPQKNKETWKKTLFLSKNTR